MTRQTPTCLSPSCRAAALPCSSVGRSSLESCLLFGRRRAVSFRVRWLLALLFGIPQLVIGLTVVRSGHQHTELVLSLLVHRFRFR